MNGATMGDIISEPVKEVKVRVQVGDPDKGDLIAKIELFEDGEVVDTNEPKQESWCWNPIRTPEPGKHYYFVKVTQADGNRLWSAPVWVTVGEK